MKAFRLRMYAILGLISLLTVGTFQSTLMAQSGQSFDQQLTELWSNYLAAKAIGDSDRQNEVFEAMKALRENNLGQIFEEAGYLFLEEGQRDLLLSKYDSARTEFLHAVDMNPHLWPAYTGLAHVRQETDGGYRQYLNLNTKGLTQTFKTKNSFFFIEASQWWLQNIYRGFQVAIALFTLILCSRRVRPFIATIQHDLSTRTSGTLAGILAMVVLALPFFLGVSYFFAAILYLALFLPFFNKRERRTVIGLFLIAAILPLLNIVLANFNHARSNPLLKAHLTQFVAGDLDNRISFLEDNRGDGELAHRSDLILGLLHKTKQNLPVAFQYFSQIPPTSDFWPEAQVNLGNLRFGAKEYQEALDYYRKAIGAEPEMFSALFNMALANARLGDHREAENLKDQAARVDADYISRIAVYENLQTANVFDAEADHMNRLTQAMFGNENPATQGWFKKPDFFLPIVLTILLLGIALYHVSVRNPVLIALVCSKCGRIFFPSDSPNNKWCSQCVSIYVRKEDLPSEAKMKKVDEVSQYAKTRRWINRAAQLALPGFKQVVNQHPLSGFLTLLVWCMLWTFLLHPASNIQHASIHYLQTNILNIFTIGIMAIYWIFFGLIPVFQED